MDSTPHDRDREASSPGPTAPVTESATVYVVDNNELARESICLLLSRMNTQFVTFSSAEEFVREYTRNPGPGCVVAEFHLPAMSGLDLQEHLNRRGIGLPFVFVTANPETPLVVRAVREGAVNVVEKPWHQSDLEFSVRQAVRQNETVREYVARVREYQNRLAALTEPEWSVLEGVLDGVSNKVLASRLHVSLRTVETRRKRIYTKTKCNSLAQLIHVVLKSGLRTYEDAAGLRRA